MKNNNLINKDKKIRIKENDDNLFYHKNQIYKKIKNGSYLQLNEIIEFLLYCSIPDEDTSKIADSLVRKFGTLHNILNASVDELTSVKGIEIKTANSLKILGKIVYMKDFPEREIYINSYQAVVELCKGFEKTDKQVYVIIFNGDLSVADVIKCETDPNIKWLFDDDIINRINKLTTHRFIIIAVCNSTEIPTAFANTVDYYFRYLIKLTCRNVGVFVVRKGDVMYCNIDEYSVLPEYLPSIIKKPISYTKDVYDESVLNVSKNEYDDIENINYEYKYYSISEYLSKINDIK